MARIIYCILLLTFASFLEAKTCNVLEYGGKADNNTDLGPAVLSAYNNCVKGSNGNVLLVPSGLFLLNSNIALEGSSYTFQIDGTITIAFNTALSGTMIQWSDCSGITLTGSGKILGQGSFWRPNNDLSKYPNRPRLLRFQNCNNCKISGVTLVNSPMFHLTVIGNNNEVHNVMVDADIIGETDAFDMSGNNNYVHDVEVTNGDECVTVKTPTDGFVAENIICHYTAGCNIGSFGNGNTQAAVQNVFYKNVTMYNSDAGAQIKTYPNNLGFVKNVTYDNFVLSSVAYPIAINVYWCGGSNNCPSATGTLAISNINFNNFKGTQATNSRPAVLLNCLPKYECKDIDFSSVSITANNGATHDSITNACGSGRSSVPKC
jgi:rhamnogalacturonan hydrolase